MSVTDYLTDTDMELAGEGIVVMANFIRNSGINIADTPGMTEPRMKALIAIVMGIGPPPPEPGRIDGAPDDDFALAAAEGN